LDAVDGTLVVPTICLYEVFKSILRQSTRDQALRRVAVMTQATMAAFDEPLALDAALLSRELKLPMADSVILATGRNHGALLWTQNAHFEHIDGVRYPEKPHR
jgi:predicted nucleic acid-binding protein